MQVMNSCYGEVVLDCRRTTGSSANQKICEMQIYDLAVK
jgi:hypothetical protein